MIYGCYYYNITELASALDGLRESYVLYGRNLSNILKVGKPPYSLAIVDGLSVVRRVAEPNVIVVDSKSALLNTNVDKLLFTCNTRIVLQKLLLQCKQNQEKLTLEIHEPELTEVIDHVTTKSVLTDIQTLVNKVNPYDLRKKVHKLVISYFYGKASRRDISKLKVNNKLYSIYRVLTSDNAKNVRNAVLEYRKINDEVKVASMFKVHTFEILYVFNSFKKL